MYLESSTIDGPHERDSHRLKEFKSKVFPGNENFEGDMVSWRPAFTVQVQLERFWNLTQIDASSIPKSGANS